MIRNISKPINRNLCISRLTDTKTNFYLKNEFTYNQFSAWFKEAKFFLIEHNNLLVVRADKGNVTVIINKIQYDDLADTTYY